APGSYRLRFWIASRAARGQRRPLEPQPLRTRPIISIWVHVCGGCGANAPPRGSSAVGTKLMKNGQCLMKNSADGVIFSGDLAHALEISEDDVYELARAPLSVCDRERIGETRCSLTRGDPADVRAEQDSNLRPRRHGDGHAPALTCSWTLSS